MEGVSVWLSGRCDNSSVKIEKKTYRSKKNVIILDTAFTNNRQPILLGLDRRESRMKPVLGLYFMQAILNDKYLS